MIVENKSNIPSKRGGGNEELKIKNNYVNDFFHEFAFQLPTVLQKKILFEIPT